MNENRVKKLYVEDNWTLRMVADEFGTNHHTIRRILIKLGVPIVRTGKPRKPFTEEHKQKISETRKALKANGWVPYNKGLKTISRVCKNGKTGKELLYFNMLSHLRFQVEIEWLMQFDFETLRTLNTAITNRDGRWNITSEEYVKYIEHFYNDAQFLIVYERYKNNPCLYTKPSIDHITPKAKGGTNTLSNLQFLSWFENRCKNDMVQDEWDKIKCNIKEYLI